MGGSLVYNSSSCANLCTQHVKCVKMYVGDSPTAPGIVLPHALDKVDFLWHLGSRRTRDISQPEWRSGKVQQTLLYIKAPL